MGESKLDDNFELLDMQREFCVDAEQKFLEIEKLMDKIFSEDEPSEEGLGELFRVVHTIKGDAGYLALSRIETLAHQFENVLDSGRKGSAASWTADVLRIFKRTLDALSAEVEALNRGGEADSSTYEKALEELKSLSEAEEVKETPRTKSSRDGTQDVFQSVLKLQFAVIDGALAKQKIDQAAALRGLATVESALAYMGLEGYESAVARLKEAIAGEQGYEKAWSDLKAYFSAPSEPEQKVEVKASKSLAANPSQQTKFLRVDERLAESLLNLVGELVAVGNSFQHFQSEFEKSASSDRKLLASLKDQNKRLASLSEGLRRNVMSMRMVPLHQTFQRFTRLVRDLGEKVGKELKVEISGGELEIDKGTLELLGEPLLHLIRNSVDHGIESSVQRVVKGKDPSGTIGIHARGIGSTIILEISDDGGGISSEKILHKAVENGLIDEDTASELTREEILALIFRPGFSTAEKLTQISGRGVGMDIVKSAVEAAKGTITIASEVDVGTKMTITLPLSAALSVCLLAEAGQDVFAIPVEDIESTVKLKESQIQSLQGRMAFVYHGEIVMIDPIMSLWKDPGLRLIKDMTVLLLNFDGERRALIVDRILRREELLVKPMPGIVADIPHVSGASILGDGRSVVVLDAKSIFKSKPGEKVM